MLKIIEVHTSEHARGEYVVLQNQGLGSLNLRGWALCSDAYMQCDLKRMVKELYVFQPEISIRPYARVVLFTGGEEEEGWQETTDGHPAYCVWWGREERVWSAVGQVYLLHPASSRKVVPVLPVLP